MAVELRRDHPGQVLVIPVGISLCSSGFSCACKTNKKTSEFLSEAISAPSLQMQPHWSWDIAALRVPAEDTCAG